MPSWRYNYFYLPTLTLSPQTPHPQNFQSSMIGYVSISWASCMLLYSCIIMIQHSIGGTTSGIILIHAELHWLDVPERVKYKLGMITRRCLNGTAPGCSLRSSLCNCIKATSAFCCQSSACCAVISTEFLRTSGVLCCWSGDVEIFTKTVA